MHSPIVTDKHLRNDDPKGFKFGEISNGDGECNNACCQPPSHRAEVFAPEMIELDGLDATGFAEVRRPDLERYVDPPFDRQDALQRRVSDAIADFMWGTVGLDGVSKEEAVQMAYVSILAQLQRDLVDG